MKAIYLRQLQEVLDRALPDALPGFARSALRLSKTEREGATLFQGSRLYARTVNAGTQFIFLIPYSHRERFKAEVGWSTTGRFPAALTSHGPSQLPANELVMDEWLADFSDLYHRNRGLGHLGWDVWRCSVASDHPDFNRAFIAENMAAVSDEEARARAESAVRECVTDLQAIALPYLDEWARYRGSSVPSAKGK